MTRPNRADAAGGACVRIFGRGSASGASGANMDGLRAYCVGRVCPRAVVMVAGISIEVFLFSPSFTMPTYLCEHPTISAILVCVSSEIGRAGLGVCRPEKADFGRAGYYAGYYLSII